MEFENLDQIIMGKVRESRRPEILKSPALEKVGFVRGGGIGAAIRDGIGGATVITAPDELKLAAEWRRRFIPRMIDSKGPAELLPFL